MEYNERNEINIIDKNKIVTVDNPWYMEPEEEDVNVEGLKSLVKDIEVLSQHLLELKIKAECILDSLNQMI